MRTQVESRKSCSRLASLRWPNGGLVKFEIRAAISTPPRNELSELGRCSSTIYQCGFELMRYANTARVVATANQPIASPTLPPVSPKKTNNKSLNQQSLRHKDRTGLGEAIIAPAPKNAMKDTTQSPHLRMFCTYNRKLSTAIYPEPVTWVLAWLPQGPDR